MAIWHRRKCPIGPSFAITTCLVISLLLSLSLAQDRNSDRSEPLKEQPKDDASTTPTTKASEETTTGYLQPQQQSSSGSGITCTKDGFFRHPDNCAQFYRCQAGARFDFTCGPGMHFDKRYSLCNWKAQVYPPCSQPTKAQTQEQVASPTTQQGPPPPSPLPEQQQKQQQQQPFPQPKKQQQKTVAYSGIETQDGHYQTQQQQQPQQPNSLDLISFKLFLVAPKTVQPNYPPLASV